jgi:hypothetical protein
MNALELADTMEKEMVDGFCLGYIGDTIAMLRQQQAEIEALNQRIERMIENQSHHEGIAHAGGFEAGYQAAQAKTLTDEEIAKVAKDFFLSEYVPYDFVRAILRKAQEK